MKAILSAPGSRGDVNPMVAIGCHLKSLGYEVVISVAAPYASLAESAGLTVEPVISESTFDQAIGNARVWRPVQGPLQIFRVMIRDFLNKHREVIDRHRLSGETILVSHPLDMVSRILRESDDSIPLFGVHLQPVILRTIDDPPRLSPWWFEPRSPSWLLAACYAGIDHLVIDPLLRRSINRLRHEYGLHQPIRRVMDRWWLSPDATLALYPERFAPATSGFTEKLIHCGFPLDDVTGGGVAPPTNRPIVFTSGTANRHCRRFFEVAVSACQKMGCDGLLLSSYDENFPRNLPSNIHCHQYLSLKELLPHCSAIVHHGGIGTTSQAFAAGIPQVIRPLAFDQFDNAQRVERLKCGRWLKRDQDLEKVLSGLPGVTEAGSEMSGATEGGVTLESIKMMQGLVTETRGAVVAANKIHEMTNGWFSR
ncbi:MAG: hypothetical protein ISQ09_10800 [Rubripirellula sp.]|nr:hypothetical protein [Rubripirellula sp.]